MPVEQARRRVREDLASGSEIEGLVEVDRVAVPDAAVEGVQEAVVGAGEQHLAPFRLAVREVEIGLAVRRGARARLHVGREVLEVPRRLEQQQLRVEDVSHLVGVAGRRRPVVVGAELRRRSRRGRVVLVEVRVPLFLAGRGADRRDRGRKNRGVVQDLVAAAEIRLAAPQELNRQLGQILVGRRSGSRAPCRSSGPRNRRSSPAAQVPVAGRKSSRASGTTFATAREKIILRPGQTEIAGARPAGEAATGTAPAARFGTGFV